MNIKFPIESDFVDSYLNDFIIRSYFSDNTDAQTDSDIFKRCVHMNPLVLKISNCADRRDNVNSFIEANLAKFNEVRTSIIENCTRELSEAYSVDKILSKNNEATFNSFLSSAKLKEKESSLNICLKSKI
jgi:hypothetical protein